VAYNAVEVEVVSLTIWNKETEMLLPDEEEIAKVLEEHAEQHAEIMGKEWMKYTTRTPEQKSAYMLRQGEIVRHHWVILLANVGGYIEETLKSQDYDAWVNGNSATRTALFEDPADDLVAGLEKALPDYPSDVEEL
jgi:hypothetical protein